MTHIFRRKVYSFIIFGIAGIFIAPNLSAEELTISSYNAGGLQNHYDYLRAVVMEKLIQERYVQEPEIMALNERIQAVALKILFSSDEIEYSLAKEEWDQKGYEKIISKITQSPLNPDSLNNKWFEKSNSMITDYKTFPTIIFDKEVEEKLAHHIKEHSQDEKTNFLNLIEKTRSEMAKTIFKYHLNQDIICLQEADYLKKELFPEHYEGAFSNTSHSVNGILWNKNRFELVKIVSANSSRAFVIKLFDRISEKSILVASAHITGCNPYYVQKDPVTGKPDSKKGDLELATLIHLLDQEESDLKLIGMDSNVTSLHPRLQIVKDNSYQMDSNHYIEPTCSNPNQIINTRIDWLVLKSTTPATIINIPVPSVGLNNMLTNISDHKPIAAKVNF